MRTRARVSTSLGVAASGTSEPGLVPPAGSAVYVETDCNSSTGVCDGSGTTRPPMRVCEAGCTPTPWFDLVTGACRAP